MHTRNMGCHQMVWTNVPPKLSDGTGREVIGRQGGKGGMVFNVHTIDFRREADGVDACLYC